MANLSLRPSRGRKGREKGEKGGKGERRGKKGSTYEKRVTTTLVCYSTSALQRSITSKSENQNMVKVSKVGEQSLTRIMAATKYITINTLNKLINNVNLTVSTN